MRPDAVVKPFLVTFRPFSRDSEAVLLGDDFCGLDLEATGLALRRMVMPLIKPGEPRSQDYDICASFSACLFHVRVSA